MSRDRSDRHAAGQRGRDEPRGDHAGFSADCLETLEEIAFENTHIFKHPGGKNFATLRLNDSAAGMEVIRQLAVRELKGWA